MPKNTWNNWVVFGIALIIGLLLGWLLQGLINPRYVGNGTISTYHADSSKITLTVNQGMTGIVTSSMFGPQRKNVQIFSVTTGQPVGISDCTPPNPPMTPPNPPFQSWATGKDAVSWNLPPGNYEIRIGYDHYTAGDNILTNLQYAHPPTIIAANSSIVSSGGVHQICPTDIYFFDAACTPDDGTKILVVIQPGM